MPASAAVHAAGSSRDWQPDEDELRNGGGVEDPDEVNARIGEFMKDFLQRVFLLIYCLWLFNQLINDFRK